ncbi:thioester reductase-like protein [Mucilaginibacter oryzae]|uniref:Thioester reductase-like protein n=1 Tax=Mucilaginibacter oryzae TaxID=468058 RepID=A0A316GRG9_9SPHI|nr:SDR family oxidoreductase [Mucilaginibacter oryzae]PWK65250.1 thioester reductase-like protein [Mucilaginibacter oryzae]
MKSLLYNKNRVFALTQILVMQNTFGNLADLFINSAKVYPEQIAVEDSESSVSYNQLYKSSMAVKCMFIKNGLHPDERVIIISQKKISSIIAFWAVIFAGGVPVLLDDDDVPADLQNKLLTAAPSMVILDDNRLAHFSKSGAKLFTFNELSITASLPPDDYELRVSKICYMLFTSGTTAGVKAVIINHQNVLNYIFGLARLLELSEPVKSAHVTTFSADLGMTGFLLSVLTGGCMRIFSKIESTDPRLFIEILRKSKVQLLKSTPSHIRSVLSAANEFTENPISWLLVGGEKLSWLAAEEILRSKITKKLYNHYGPTETTIGVLLYPVLANDSNFNHTTTVPIGKPIGDNRIWLDRQADDAGELIIAGKSVGDGYFRNEPATQRGFGLYDLDNMSLRGYRSGDFCRLLPDGNFEFLYRKDRQIKVRGYRVETAEIEQALLSHPDVEFAIVRLSKRYEHGVLEAFVRLKAKGSITEKGLLAWLSKRIAPYKLPSYLYFFDQVPLTGNGKMDLDSLTVEPHRLERAEFKAATSGVWEDDVINNWVSILGEGADVQDLSFYEAGGDSLLAIQLVGRLQRIGYKVHIGELIGCKDLAQFLALGRQTSSSEESVPPSQPEHLTFSQRKFLKNKNRVENRFAQSILLECLSDIRYDLFSLAIQSVLSEHTQLTRTFGKKKNPRNTEHLNGVQVSALNDELPVVHQIQSVQERILAQMSVQTGKLFYIHAFVNREKANFILILCHHLAVDVISWHIIIDDLVYAYNKLLNGEPLLKRGENSLIVDNLNSTLVHGAIVSGKIRQPGRLFEVGRGTWDLCLSKTNVYSFTLANASPRSFSLKDSINVVDADAFLLSAFLKALRCVFNKNVFSLDVEFHGRNINNFDVSRSVAWWALTLPMLFDEYNDGPEVCHLLLREYAEIAATLNRSQSAQDLNKIHSSDILFNYLGHFMPVIGSGELLFRPSALHPGTTRVAADDYMIRFTSRFIGSKLIVDIQYRRDFLDDKQIAMVGHSFFCFLKDFISPAEKSLSVEPVQSLVVNLPTAGLPIFNPEIREPKNFDGAILLTGATGFLGIYLLREILSHTDHHIICIVRGRSAASANQRLNETYLHYFGTDLNLFRDRIDIVTGDVSLRDFGIEPENHKRLKEKVGVVLHAAADTNLLKPYIELEKTNVSGVREVIHFAKTAGNLPLHHVSSLAVSGCSPMAFCKFSERDFDIGQKFVSDYEKSKYDGELLVRSYFDSGGKGQIYRTGHIAADSSNAVFQINANQNRIIQILHTVGILGMSPSDYNETVSFSFVDCVARGIVSCIDDPPVLTNNCLHVESPHRYQIKEIAAMLSIKSKPIKMVDMSAFKKAVVDYNGGKQNVAMVNAGLSWIERHQSQARNIDYQQAVSIDLLASKGIYFPKITPEWIKGMVAQIPLIEKKDQLSSIVADISTMAPFFEEANTIEQ